jgi:hypothetical protein
MGLFFRFSVLLWSSVHYQLPALLSHTSQAQPPSVHASGLAIVREFCPGMTARALGTAHSSRRTSPLSSLPSSQ